MSNDQCRVLRGDLAAAAIGRLDTSPLLALQAHLDGCLACRIELKELARVATAVGNVDLDHVVDGPTVPSDLGDRIIATVRNERASQPQDRQDAPAPGPRMLQRRRRTLRLTIGAALAAAALIGAIVLRPSAGSNAPHRTVALTAYERGATADALLASVVSGTEVRFRARGLDSGHAYWLWLTGADGNRIGAGTFTADRHGRVDVHTTSALAYANVQRVWLTETDQGIVLDTAPRQPGPPT